MGAGQSSTPKPRGMILHTPTLPNLWMPIGLQYSQCARPRPPPNIYANPGICTVRCARRASALGDPARAAVFSAKHTAVGISCCLGLR